MNNTDSSKDWLQPLLDNHRQLMEYVDALTDEELLYAESGRWNAGQQLQHVYLCLAVISQALSSKAFIEQTFGRIDRATLSSDEVIARYKAGLAGGGKAPERFVPGAFEPAQKSKVLTDLEQLLQTLRDQIESYSDAELDSLVLPHPFVGKLTIREMFYLMTEHPGIHQASIARGLQTKTEAVHQP